MRGGVLLLVAVAATASAQEPARAPRPEARLEAIAGRPAALQALAGVGLPLGNYVRLGIAAGGGVARAEGTRPGVGSVRAEAVARFLLDPFRQMRWGMSLGGGVAWRHEPGYGSREYLVLVADLEGSGAGRIVPALQVGIGGGARLGVVLRGATAERR